MEKLTSPSQLREQAKRFARAGAALQQAADILDGSGPSGEDGVTEPPLRRGARLDQLRDYLAKHGPTPRAKLFKEAGLPLGTLSSLLAKKGIFKRDSKGRWKLIDGSGTAAGNR